MRHPPLPPSIAPHDARVLTEPHDAFASPRRGGHGDTYGPARRAAAYALGALAIFPRAVFSRVDFASEDLSFVGRVGEDVCATTPVSEALFERLRICGLYKILPSQHWTQALTRVAQSPDLVAVNDLNSDYMHCLVDITTAYASDLAQQAAADARVVADAQAAINARWHQVEKMGLIIGLGITLVLPCVLGAAYGGWVLYGEHITGATRRGIAAVGALSSRLAVAPKRVADRWRAYRHRPYEPLLELQPLGPHHAGIIAEAIGRAAEKPALFAWVDSDTPLTEDMEAVEPLLKNPQLVCKLFHGMSVLEYAAFKRSDRATHIVSCLCQQATQTPSERQREMIRTTLRQALFGLACGSVAQDTPNRGLDEQEFEALCFNASVLTYGLSEVTQRVTYLLTSQHPVFESRRFWEESTLQFVGRPADTDALRELVRTLVADEVLISRSIKLVEADVLPQALSSATFSHGDQALTQLDMALTDVAAAKASHPQWSAMQTMVQELKAAAVSERLEILARHCDAR